MTLRGGRERHTTAADNRPTQRSSDPRHGAPFGSILVLTHILTLSWCLSCHLYGWNSLAGDARFSVCPCQKESR